MTTKWIGIAKLQEEMGELQTVLGKLHAYPDGQHPDMSYSAPLTTLTTLTTRLCDELADVIAAAEFFAKMNLDAEAKDYVEHRIGMKHGRYEQWHASGDHMTGVEVDDPVEE